MARLLHIDILSPTIHPIGDEVPHGKSGGTSKGRKLYFAFLGAVLVIVLTIGGFMILSNYTNKTNVVDRIEPPPTGKPTNPPPMDSSGIAKPTGNSKQGGLKQIPWLGANEKLIGSLINVRGEIYSITSGPEGVILISGIAPGIIPNPLLPGGNIGELDVMFEGEAEVGTRFVASAPLLPLDKLFFDPIPVQPYERGTIMRTLDSLARVNGISEVSSDAIGREEVEGGSRYLIAVKGIGKLNDIVVYVNQVKNIGRMIDIGRFALESVSEKPLVKGDVRMGITYRIYDLPALAEPTPEEPLPDSSS